MVLDTGVTRLYLLLEPRLADRGLRMSRHSLRNVSRYQLANPGALGIRGPAQHNGDDVLLFATD